MFGGGGFQFQFSTKKAQAAVLMLPDGAHRYVAKNRSIYEKYASENGIAWYQYANGTLGRGAPNGSLYLVTGCDKCRSWGTAAISQPERNTRGFSEIHCSRDCRGRRYTTLLLQYGFWDGDTLFPAQHHHGSWLGEPMRLRSWYYYIGEGKSYSAHATGGSRSWVRGAAGRFAVHVLQRPFASLSSLFDLSFHKSFFFVSAQRPFAFRYTGY